MNNPSPREIAASLPPGLRRIVAGMEPHARYLMRELKEKKFDMADLARLEALGLATTRGYWHLSPLGIEVHATLKDEAGHA